MRAAWYERTGPAAEVMTVGDLDEPRPGPGEVLVRVAASGVNPSDVKRRAGSLGPPPYPRVVPHHDGAGTVVAVGAGVDARRVGERVWLHSVGWKRPFGTAADFTVVPAERAVVLPAGTSFAEGACLGVPAMTAHYALFSDGALQGKTVLVTGGAGAVGFYAVALAAWAGARVFATVSSEAKAREARRAGAERAIDYREEDVRAVLLEATGGLGVDHVVEVDFAANLATALAVLRPGGVIAAYASASQPEPTIPFYPLMWRNIHIRTFLVYEIAESAQQRARADITAWLASGRAQHSIARTFPLEAIAEAHVAVESGAEIGNVVIDVHGR
jgi:NADPH2:quinone reductase